MDEKRKRRRASEGLQIVRSREPHENRQHSDDGHGDEEDLLAPTSAARIVSDGSWVQSLCSDDTQAMCLLSRQAA